MRKIILTTGGTGGHIFPALAVAEVLKEERAELLFMGGTYGQEAELAKKAGIPFIGLPGRGFLGRGLRAIPAAFDQVAAMARAIACVRKFRPCAVAAFGGYASFAPALAAILLRIPLLLHEQNAIAGVSNRILSRFATIICASLPDTIGFKKAFVFTGNPVRAGIRNTRPRNGDIRKHLLVLGGSQGAHALNMYIASILDRLKAFGVEIRHQTGKKDFEEICGKYVSAGYDRSCVSAFIDDMAAVYDWADLVVSRAGASTVAEIELAALPAILVPFPAAIHDHQTMNGRALADAGAAILVPELRINEICDAIIDLLGSPRKLAQMSQASENLSRPDAAIRVAAEIEKLCVRA